MFTSHKTFHKVQLAPKKISLQKLLLPRLPNFRYIPGWKICDWIASSLRSSQ